MEDLPEKFEYFQSIEQSFYFIEEVELTSNEIEIGDWIVAYNDDVIVGAQKWNGKYTDIPAMGYDGTDATLGYCKNGDVPTFKIFIDKTGELISLVPINIEPWSDLGVHIIAQLNQSIILPEHFEFSYPRITPPSKYPPLLPEIAPYPASPQYKF